MDQMDIDYAVDDVDVPDTPDRPTIQRIKGGSVAENENHSLSTPFHQGQQHFLDGAAKDRPVATEGGNIRLSLRPTKCNSSTSSSRHPGSSISSRNPVLFRRGVIERNNGSNDSMHPRHSQNERPSCISKSSSFRDDSFGRNSARILLGNDSHVVPGKDQAGCRKKSGLANRASSSHDPTNFSYVSEGKLNMGKVSSSTDSEEAVEFGGNTQTTARNGGFLSIKPTTSPRKNRQKRLVRNGCISPNNIAKGKQLLGIDINASTAVAQSNRAKEKQLAGIDGNASAAAAQSNSGSTASSAPAVTPDMLVAEDNESHIRKGKGLISHPCSSKESNFRNKNLHSSSLVGTKKKAVESSNYIRDVGTSIEQSDGWRSTRNQRGLIDLSSGEEQYVNRKVDTPRCSVQHNGNRVVRGGKGSRSATGNDYPEDPNFIYSENVCSQPFQEPVSGTRLGRLSGHHSVANTFMKRQKQGSTSSRVGECSTSLSDDPEVVFLHSSAEPENLPSSVSVDRLQPVFEIDEFSPQFQPNALDEDDRDRQVEADELLARELQEQLYNEVPVSSDAHERIFPALYSNNGSSVAGLDARHSLLRNLRRQYQSMSSSNGPRRGTVARTSTSGRMTRLRSRFPGQPRTIMPSIRRTSLFPANMDIDMRMHILGALEEFSDMELGTGALQIQRDFNESDYEMLLALDDNNDQHSGASIHQISGLPQSTVQSDNFEEACAICLETPKIGDTIRHLPCLHKFHVDCIDPWLRRRTSCPICKSSVT